MIPSHHPSPPTHPPPTTFITLHSLWPNWLQAYTYVDQTLNHLWVITLRQQCIIESVAVHEGKEMITDEFSYFSTFWLFHVYSSDNEYSAQFALRLYLFFLIHRRSYSFLIKFRSNTSRGPQEICFVFSQRQLSDRKDFKSCTVPLWDFQVHHHGDSASPQPLKVTWPAAMLYCVCVCFCAVCARAILWYERLYLCSDATRAIHFKKTADNQVLLPYYLGTLIRSRFWDLFSSDLLYSFCNALSHAYQLAT